MRVMKSSEKVSTSLLGDFFFSLTAAVTHTLNLFFLPIITQVLNESLLIDAMINHDELSKRVRIRILTIEIVQINKKSRKPNLTSVVAETTKGFDSE